VPVRTPAEEFYPDQSLKGELRFHPREFSKKRIEVGGKESGNKGKEKLVQKMPKRTRCESDPIRRNPQEGEVIGEWPKAVPAEWGPA